MRHLKRWTRSACLLLLALGLTLWLSSLLQGATRPVDAVLVLGGSIRREIYVAQQRVSQPQPLPVLISQGSADPCIEMIFEREHASLAAVWLEKCAQSTFDNFRYSLPVLKQWGSRHVQIVTSRQHLPRAQWMGQIMLGAHGIWVDVVGLEETGRPGNRESLLKTVLDVGRSGVWAVVSQVYWPQCAEMVPLAEVDWADWQAKGFKCEHQAGLD